ncbi:hypothetical protein BGX29_001540, partial [Mortierella sp. GBA35]
HVKWVCFEHYQERYRATALFSFVQSIETAGGVYDAHLRSITIGLKSSTSAKDFFRRLVSQGPAIQGLDVTLDWKFRSADLVMMVEMLSKTNIKIFNLDPNDVVDGVAVKRWSDSRKGRYHSLLALLSNKNLRSLLFSNFYLLGSRTSNLPSSYTPSWLQSFQFYGYIAAGEHPVALPRIDRSEADSQGTDDWMDADLSRAIYSLKKLQRLHIFGWTEDISISTENGPSSDPVSLKEIVCGAQKLNTHFTQEVVQRSNTILEVLVLFSYFSTYNNFNLTPPSLQSDISHLNRPSPPPDPLASQSPYSRLTHLDLQVGLTSPSLEFISSVLPRLNLIHFASDVCTLQLLKHCSYATLKSLSISHTDKADLQPLLDIVNDPQGACQIHSLRLHIARRVAKPLAHIIRTIPLKRLYLSELDYATLSEIMGGINLSKLQVLSIRNVFYRREIETELALRSDEFTESFVMELDINGEISYAGNGGAIRTTKGSSTALASHRVRLMGIFRSTSTVTNTDTITGIRGPDRSISIMAMCHIHQLCRSVMAPMATTLGTLESRQRLLARVCRRRSSSSLAVVALSSSLVADAEDPEPAPPIAFWMRLLLSRINQAETTPHRLGLPFHRAICSLKKLHTLHLYRLSEEITDDDTLNLSARDAMKEIVFTGDKFIKNYFRKAIRQSMATLEVFVLCVDYQQQPADVTSILLLESIAPVVYEGKVALQPFAESLLSKLSYLDLSTGPYSEKLLPHANFATLKSLSVQFIHQEDLQAVLNVFERNSLNCQIDSMKIFHNSYYDIILPDFFSTLPLRVLLLSGFEDVLHRALETVDPSRLQVLSICGAWYDWPREAILAARSNECTENLAVEPAGLQDTSSSIGASDDGMRGLKGTSTRLARNRVRFFDCDFHGHHSRYMQHALPKHAY